MKKRLNSDSGGLAPQVNDAIISDWLCDPSPSDDEAGLGLISQISTCNRRSFSKALKLLAHSDATEGESGPNH